MDTITKLAEALRNILKAADKPENPSLDSPTEFAIAQARGMKIGDIRSIANKALAAYDAQPVQQARQPLTDAQIEKLREKTFSTTNPFCPVDSKSMRKAVRAAEWEHGITGEQP